MPEQSVLLPEDIETVYPNSPTINESTDLNALVAGKDDAVIIDVPVFTDGKVFSISKQLRALGFTGQIIVSGNFITDQVGYLSQCGVSAFVVSNDSARAEVERLLERRIDSYHFQEVQKH